MKKKIQPRWYQQDAIDKALAAIKKGDNALIQAPTRSGKSVIMAFVMIELLKIKPDMRFLVVIESALLVGQLAGVIHNVVGIRPGICCGTMDNKKDTTKQITVGTRQTLVNEVFKADKFNVVFIDEAHLVGRRRPAEIDSEDSGEEEENKRQYFIILDAIKKINERVRLCLFTATPWGLTYGYMYGRHKGIGEPLCEELTCKIRYDSLYADGSIVPMRGIVYKGDGKVYKNYVPSKKAGGVNGTEYNMKVIGRERIKYNKAIPDAVKRYCDGHNWIIVFCVDIKNVEDVVKRLINEGITAAAYHSKVKDHVKVLKDYKAGKYRCLVAVDKPSIGFDHPETSCVVMASDTNSSSLFLQRACRCMTPCEGKQEALLVDMTQNSDKHLRRTPAGYDLDSPVIRIPACQKRKKEEEGEEDRSIPMKTCPGIVTETFLCPCCSGVLSIAELAEIKRKLIAGRLALCPICGVAIAESDTFAYGSLSKVKYRKRCGATLDLRTRKCKFCGHEFGASSVDFDLSSMEEVSFGKPKAHEINGDSGKNVDLYEVVSMSLFDGGKDGMIGVTMKVINADTGLNGTITDFVLLPPWYKGWVASAGRKKWDIYVGKEEAVIAETSESHKKNMWLARKKFRQPASIIASINGKFWEVRKYFFAK